MRTGAENRKELYAAIVLGAIAIFVLVYAFIPSGRHPAASAGQGPQVQVLPRHAEAQSQSIDPRLRLDLLAASEKVTYEGSGRDIFGAEPAPPPIPTPVVSPVDAPRVVEGPPPPPEIKLKFFGFANRPGDQPRIFLKQDDDTFVAGEGDIVNRRYKVLHIMRDSVEIEDLLYNHSQRIPLTQS